MKPAFYMVFVDGGNSPSYRHSTPEGAETEAKRLAELTGKKTWTLCTIKSFELTKFKVEDCRPDDDLP